MMNPIHSVVRGTGRPLLLIHGLGSNARSWNPILDALAAQRETIAVNLPGCGTTPRLDGVTSPWTIADALVDFIDANGLRGVDVAGHSLGGQIALELVRRGGIVGSTVALAPGGFWRGWHRHAAFLSLSASVRMVRLMREALPLASAHPLGRWLLTLLISRKGAGLRPEWVSEELRSYAISEGFDELVYRGIYGGTQQGAPAGSVPNPVVIGWGRQDRLCLPSQARVAMRLFPDARLHWIDQCGHYVQWDQPRAVASLILRATGGSESATRGADERAFEGAGSDLPLPASAGTSANADGQGGPLPA